MIVRLEEQRDFPAVYEINKAAFETNAEAKLVEQLRKVASPFISLVAEKDAAVVGHILFTPVTLSDYPQLSLMGLAPMAVSEDFRGSGVGSAPVEAGLERCRDLGAVAVVVLGYPAYYSRFRFRPSVEFDIRSEYDVPSDVFMVLELEAAALEDVQGTIHYHPAFGGL